MTILIDLSSQVLSNVHRPKKATEQQDPRSNNDNDKDDDPENYQRGLPVVSFR